MLLVPSSIAYLDFSDSVLMRHDFQLYHAQAIAIALLALLFKQRLEKQWDREFRS